MDRPDRSLVLCMHHHTWLNRASSWRRPVRPSSQRPRLDGSPPCARYMPQPAVKTERVEGEGKGSWCAGRETPGAREHADAIAQGASLFQSSILLAVDSGYSKF